MSIKFDTVELVNTTYTPRYAKHESSPDREIVTLPITRQNGSVKISSRYGEKTITLEGIITGTSMADLESKIDIMKELFSRQDKNLDIDWNGGTRRYVATCTKHNFDRDHYNIAFCPWSAEFMIPLGVGTDTSATSLYDTSALTADTTTINPLTFAGSAQPKPVITVNMSTVGSAQVVKLINNDTGQFIKIDGPFAGSDVLIVDCNALTVTKNGTAITFRGVLPLFYIGGNSFSMTIIGGGSVIDQTQYYDNGNRSVTYDYGTGIPWDAQSFIPAESGYVDYFEVTLDKDGSPGGTVQFLIFSDVNNAPGVNLSGGGYNIAASAVTSKSFYAVTWTSGTKPFLTAGTRYWLVKNPGTISGTDISNFVGWYYANGLTRYPTGKAMARATSASAWINGASDSQVSPGRVTTGDFEFAFITYMGSGGASSHSVRLRVSYTKTWL